MIKRIIFILLTPFIIVYMILGVVFIIPFWVLTGEFILENKYYVKVIDFHYNLIYKSL